MGPLKDRLVHVKWLDQVEYGAAWEMQKTMVVARATGEQPDTLLLLEHPAVYTLGRSGRPEHLLLDEAERQREGIGVYYVDRGGDITYHGPGQLVGYPLLDLKKLFRARGYPRPDLHQYLRDLEEVLIRALASFGVSGWRYQGYTGVWVNGLQGAPLKIAAIGVKVSSKGVSSHGFALNVNPNLEHFEGIIPCGIQQHGVTSLAQLYGPNINVSDLIPVVVEAFSQVFQVETSFVAPSLSAYNL